MLTTLGKKRKNQNKDTLVGRVLGPGKTKLTFIKMLSGPKKRKKGGAMLVIDKTSCPVDYNNLLIDTEVSRFQEIQDNLQRFMRDYLDNGLSLLEIDYQPNI